MWQEIFAEVVEVVLWSSTLEIRIELERVPLANVLKWRILDA